MKTLLAPPFRRREISLLVALVFSATLASRRAAACFFACPPPPPSPPPTYGPVATTPNQEAVAGALDSVSASATAEMQAALNQINGLTHAQQQAAFSQMDARQYGGLSGAAESGTEAVTSAVSNRLAQLRSGSGDGGALAYGNVKGEQWYPGVSLADGVGETNAGLLGSPPRKLGYYGSLLGAIGRQYGDSNGPGYSFNGEGFSVGGDYRVSDGIAVGVSGGLVHTHASVDQGAGTTAGRSYKYGAYGTAARAGWYGDAYFGGGLDFYTAQREIAALGRSAGSNPQGHEFNMKLGLGYDLKEGNSTVTPFAALSHDRMSVGSFGENGAGALDLNVSPSTLKSTKAALGFRVKCGNGARFTPYFTFAYQHEFEPQDSSLTSSFTGGGQTFVTALATPSQEAALIGVGFDAPFAKNVTGHAGYDGEYRSGYFSQSLNGNVRLKF